MKKRYVIIGFLIIILACMTYAVLKLKSYVRTLNDPKYLSSILSKEIECPVHIEEVKIGLSGNLILDKIMVKKASAIKGNEEVLFIPKARILFNLLNVLIKPQPESIDYIELDEPNLSITQDLNEWLSRLIRKMNKRGKTEKRKYPDIVIKSGSLSVSLGESLSEWVFKKIKGRIRSKGSYSEISFKGNSEDLTEKWEIEGKIYPEEWKGLTLNLRDIDIGALCDRFPGMFTVPVDGKACIKAVSSGNDFYKWDGNLQIDELTVKNNVITDIKSGFQSKSGQIDFKGFTFELFGGTVNGDSRIIQNEKSNPTIMLKGSFKDVYLNEIIKTSYNPFNNGRCYGTFQVVATGKDVSARGRFLVPKGIYSTSIPFTELKGEYGYSKDTLSIKNSSVNIKEGKILIDGTIKGNSYNLGIMCDPFNMSSKTSDKDQFKLPANCNIKGKITGSAKESCFEGEMSFPEIFLLGTQIKNTKLSGKLGLRKDACFFDNLKLNLSDSSFELSGSIKQSDNDNTLIAVNNINPGILDKLFKIETMKAINLDKNEINLVMNISKKEVIGKITALKGNVSGFQFSGIQIDFTSKDGKPFNLSGNITGKELISFTGNYEKEKMLLQASSKKITLNDITLTGPKMLLTVPGNGKLSGGLIAQEFLIKKDRLDNVNINFQEDASKPAQFTIAGNIFWQGNPMSVNGYVKKDISNFCFSSSKFDLKALRFDEKSSKLAGTAQVEMIINNSRESTKRSIKLISSDLSLNGKKYPPLNAQFSQNEDDLNFSSLVLGDKNKGQAIELEGMLSLKKNTVSLKSNLKEQSLSELADLLEENNASPSSKQTIQGKLTGLLSIEGPSDNPVTVFDGRAKDLSFKSFVFSDGKLSLKLSSDSMTGSFTPDNPDKLIGSLLQSPSKSDFSDSLAKGWKSMNISFSQKKDESMKINGDSSNDLLGKVKFYGEIGKSSWDITMLPSRFSLKDITFNSPEIHLSNTKDKTSGKLIAPSGKMKNMEIGSPKFTFEETENKKILLNGTCRIMDNDAVIKGEMGPESSLISIKIPEMDVKNLTFLPMKDDKLTGTASVETKIAEGKEKVSSYVLSSDNLQWNKKKLPKIYLEGEEKKGLFLISVLKLYIDGKPVTFSGNICPGKQTCTLNGRIEELYLPSVIDMMGGEMPDVTANLSGALSIDGEIKKPDFRFEGRMLNLVYQGREMGDGNLNISGNPQTISGRLDLDKRPKYTAGISQANVEISYYFTIEGTPKAPVIKPQAANTKFNVNPSLIWNLFRMVR